tara:strand:- start:459 stop:839 length:381 start_codon:yes stop_codon:yes gene_type:complete
MGLKVEIRMPIEEKYKTLYEDEKATYLKYKDPDKASADGHEADAEDYARKMVERAKTRDAKKTKQSKPTQKSKGGTIKKPAMAYGGTANMKKHMYAAGGQVTDNMKGLKALAKKRPDVVKKMGYNV